MTERQWVDGSDRTMLALCSCGWRDLRTDKAQAWAAASAHAQHAHAGDSNDTARRMAHRHRP